MDLSTSYLGLKLPHPLMPGASPMVDDLDLVRRLEDAGAAAIVMHSLFEEQILADQLAALQHLDSPGESFAEALTYFPETAVYAVGPDEYLNQLRRIKETVSCPVIGSLNGITPGGWTEYARLMESAGADALELNLYFLATRTHEDGEAVERRSREIVAEVCQEVTIPVAVKLSPFYTALPHFAVHLREAGAAGLVLFNRFYQPEIDIETLEVERKLGLSDPSELNLRLQWLAILAGQVPFDLAASGGVHSAADAIKAVMSGACAVQMVSALLKNGPEHLAKVRQEMEQWMEAHEYQSLGQMCGSMSVGRSPHPLAYARANYIRLLQSWHSSA